MGDLLSLGDAAPQIAIAVVIVCAALLVARFVLRMGKSPASKPSKRDQELVKKLEQIVKSSGCENGDGCRVQVEQCKGRFDSIDKRQAKVWGALRSISTTQFDILSFLTDGKPPSDPPALAYDIDDEPTGDTLNTE